MWNIILDGAFILYRNAVAIAVFGITAYSFGIRLISHPLQKELDARVRLIAGAALGSVVLSILTFILFGTAYFFPFLITPGGYMILLFALVLMFRKFNFGRIKLVYSYYDIFGVLILLILMRLAFLKHIILPPYSDSPIHYQIVAGFLHPSISDTSRLSFATIFSNYYHFGFHSLAAWLSSVAIIDPAFSISLLGQLFLVIAPASVFFLVYVLTGDLNGAVFAGLLAAIGWIMPAFAVNWGKFPAIASLSTTPAVLAYLLLVSTEKPVSRHHVVWGILLSFGILLLHTRSGVFLFLTVFFYYLTRKLDIEKELGFFKAVRYSLLYGLTLWSLSRLLVDFYSGVPVWIILLVLMPFAFQHYPRLAVGAFFFTFGIWLLSIPFDFLGVDLPILIDRQYLAIMSFIPLSVMGGAGLAGIMKKVAFAGLPGRLIPIVVCSVVVVNFIQDGTVYPDRCCNYYGESDAIVFNWIRENASEHTLVLISTFEGNGQVAGTDAGIWLFPLIRQPTNKIPFNADWDSPVQAQEICDLSAKEVLIYAGGRSFSFDKSQLERVDWIDLVFTMEETSIYKVSRSHCGST